MKQFILISVCIVILITGAIKFVPAAVDVGLPHDFLTLLVNSLTDGTTNFTQITWSDGTTQTSAGGSGSSIYAIYADTVATSTVAGGHYINKTTTAKNVQIPNPSASLINTIYVIGRDNTGGVSGFVTSGSIGRAGTTVYNHPGAETDSSIALKCISAVSWVQLWKTGTWAFKN